MNRILLIFSIFTFFVSSILAQNTDPKDPFTTGKDTNQVPVSDSNNKVDTSTPKTSSKYFAHPLQIEPVAVYSKVRANISYWDRNFNKVYEEVRSINAEGELKFWENFSIVTSVGRTQVVLTDSPTETTWDRANVGLKYAKVIDTGSSQWLIGGGIRFYDQKRNSLFRERENPEYYLIRPNFGIGFKKGIFEIMSEIRFQTETNRKGRESSLEDFRRYYQFGIAPSLALGESFRIFTELEYREPFDKTVDTNTRFFNFYPGVSYKTESMGTFSLSLMAALLPKSENAIDRGIRFSYFYFFDTGN